MKRSMLNGHIHQTLQKVEGNVTFHSARSTAFPQPQPGSAASPGPIKNVPADKLRSVLGITKVAYVERNNSLALVDSAAVVAVLHGVDAHRKLLIVGCKARTPR